MKDCCKDAQIVSIDVSNRGLFASWERLAIGCRKTGSEKFFRCSFALGRKAGASRIPRCRPGQDLQGQRARTTAVYPVPVSNLASSVDPPQTHGNGTGVSQGGQISEGDFCRTEVQAGIAFLPRVQAFLPCESNRFPASHRASKAVTSDLDT